MVPYSQSIFSCHIPPKQFRFLRFMPSLGVRSLCCKLLYKSMLMWKIEVYEFYEYFEIFWCNENWAHFLSYWIVCRVAFTVEGKDNDKRRVSRSVCCPNAFLVLWRRFSAWFFVKKKEKKSVTSTLTSLHFQQTTFQSNYLFTLCKVTFL